jgi:hypothetical protein
MHDHPIRGGAATDPDRPLKQAVLGLIVYDHEGLWSLSELDRTLQASAEARTGDEPSRAQTEDVVQQLYAAGLVHRVGQFVFATRAAVEATRHAA